MERYFVNRRTDGRTDTQSESNKRKSNKSKSLKMAAHRAKISEIWDSGVMVTCIWDTYDLLVF